MQHRDKLNIAFLVCLLMGNAVETLTVIYQQDNFWVTIQRQYISDFSLCRGVTSFHVRPFVLLLKFDHRVNSRGDKKTLHYHVQYESRLRQWVPQILAAAAAAAAG